MTLSFWLLATLLTRKGLPCWLLDSGLELDFRGMPFGATPGLIAMAREGWQLFASCEYIDEQGHRCKSQKANRTQRLIDGKPASWDSPQVLVGGGELYQARCEVHHEVPGRPY